MVWGRVTGDPAWAPAETEEASAILAMDTSPQFTAMSAWAPPEPSLEVVKVAALCRLGHSVLSVVVTTWTEAEAPAARDRKRVVKGKRGAPRRRGGPEQRQ